MLTLLAMIGLFLLVLGLVIVLLMGMFFSSDMGGIFVNVFNYATSTGIADLVTVGVMLIILFAAFAVTERMLDSALPLIVQMIIELIVFIPIPTFFFMAWGLEYRWAGVLCVLIFALPAVYDLGSNVYIKLEEIKENKNSKVD